MTPASRDKLIGWGFVAGQVVLIVALVLIPGSDDWPAPAWVRAAGTFTVVVGLAIVVVASLKLGSALTPTPVPNGRGEMASDGLYSLVRHPIYSGVITIVVGLVIGSASFVALALGIAIIGFFNIKAAWEERQLTRHFSGYGQYVADTPRFIPWRRDRRS